MGSRGEPEGTAGKAEPESGKISWAVKHLIHNLRMSQISKVT
jgi:hypothetical protein